jgi:hypothetical protein
VSLGKIKAKNVPNMTLNGIYLNPNKLKDIRGVTSCGSKYFAFIIA